MEKLKDKIRWRLKFLLKEKKKKSINSLLLNLLPSCSKIQNSFILREIKNNKSLEGFIDFEKRDGDLIFNFKSIKIKFPANSCLIGLIADYLGFVYPDQSGTEQNILSSTIIEGPYEHKDVFLDEGDYVIDAGANIGLFSIFAARKVGSKGKIFSFEPISETKKILNDNIALNEIKNIESFQLALGQKNEYRKFFLDPQRLSRASGFFKEGKESDKVKVLALDEFLEEEEISKIDFLKADIEGMERDLLRGAKKTIKKFKPKISICSYHRPDDSKVLEEIITGFVPDYKLEHKYKKIYFWIPQR